MVDRICQPSRLLAELPKNYDAVSPASRRTNRTPPPLISAQFNKALQLALPLLFGLPEGQAYGVFPTWMKWISTLQGSHQVLLSPNQWTASTLHLFLRADPEPLDITETLTFLPPIHLLSLENESDAMDVDVEYYDILPDPIGEVHSPRPDDFVVLSPIDPNTEGGYDGHALDPPEVSSRSRDGSQKFDDIPPYAKHV